MLTVEQALKETFQLRADEVGEPADLAQRVIAAHGVDRRQRWTVVAASAALIALVLAVVVPLQMWRGGDLPVAGGGDSYPYPPRGSLAGDAEFVDAMLRMQWGDDGLNPPLDTRQVVFAGDVPGGRWALVVGVLDGEQASAWITGPAMARPGQMMVTTASRGDLGRAESYGDFTVPGRPLVVIGRPGDVIEISQRPDIDSQGRVSREYQAVPDESGVAVTAVPEGGASTTFRLLREGRVVYTDTAGGISAYELWAESRIAEAAVGSLGTPDPALARSTLAELTERTGLGPDVFDVSILWGNSGAFPGLLLSATLPSGAVAVVGSCGTESTRELRLLELYPAGTDPQDLMFVLHCRDLGAVASDATQEYLIVLGPIRTSTFEARDVNGIVGFDSRSRLVYVTDEPLRLSDFRALDADGAVLATAQVGTVVDFGP